MNKSLPKKDMYCSNCGGTDHYFKGCPEPVTSYGVILINIDIDESINDQIISAFKNSTNDNRLSIEDNTGGINIKEYGDMELFSIIKNSVKFLLIQRKHTLGFLEFIRGRYNIDNVEGIIFLFKQMTPDEIERIKNNTFDELWNFVWGNKNRVNFQNEYIMSKDKFNKLKNENNGSLSLNFYIDNIEPSWSYAEWGFPKGRRNNKEEDLECAIREFQEESNYNPEDYVVIDYINPLIESLIGTNGINYRHVYYIGMAINKKDPVIDNTNQIQSCEIGDIRYFTYEEAINIIRDYHTDRQKLLTKLYINIVNNLIIYFKNLN